MRGLHPTAHGYGSCGVGPGAVCLFVLVLGDSEDPDPSERGGVGLRRVREGERGSTRDRR